MKRAFRLLAEGAWIAIHVIIFIAGIVVWVSMSPSMQIASAIFMAGGLIGGAIHFRKPTDIVLRCDVIDGLNATVSGGGHVYVVAPNAKGVNAKGVAQ
ncbi:hypothetical protein J2847_005846 [Azospirillum agricola]|uniref:hypothetical protein n=1 Tax=Azospirillum agricola TaxID=1720247 RepID=UPI001AE4414E|nr:hypothetical protein [Azospirillum agricola]MBP2232517.1 hypothetical protein [Azospirillum agricola]